MALQGMIQAAPDGAVGFDADCVVSLAAAQQFVAQGYSFCLRYLSKGEGQRVGDLSADEAADLLQAGLALMPVQHVYKEGWAPSAALGTTLGGHAADNAAAVGFPQGVNVWCDVESVSADSSTEDVIAYCNAWFAAVKAAGYVPGLYVGPDAGLTGSQLYDLEVEHYWKSASRVPAVPVRGYQMIQTLVPDEVNGISIDQDTVQTDGKGGQVLWLIADSE